MTLIEKSTLVTAPSGTKVAKYELAVGTKVNSNELVLDSKADTLKKEIDECYKKIEGYFKSIATEYRSCANKSVKGTKIVASLKKVATNCEKQGEYCGTRKKQLNTLFTKDKNKKDEIELENAIDNLQTSSNTNSSEIDNVKSDLTTLSDRTESITQSNNALNESVSNLWNRNNELEERIKVLEESISKLGSGTGTIV